MLNGVFLDSASIGHDLPLTRLENLKVNWQMYPTTSAEQTLERCLQADIVITNKVVLDKNLIQQLPNLKLICVAATGTNNIDIDAANTANIQVKNAVAYAGSSVAQLTFALLLQLVNKVQQYQTDVANGNWCKSPFFCLLDHPITELAGKTIGLIGYGNLAQSVEKIATAFEMTVLIGERKAATEVRPGRTNFHQVLQQADVISIHCPLTAKTTDLITMAELQTMKNSAILINTARGGIVNENDLITALNQGVISAAATDVLTQEPPAPNHPMLNNQPDNLIITPHIAWASYEARSRLLDQLADNIQRFMDNR